VIVFLFDEKGFSYWACSDKCKKDYKKGRTKITFKMSPLMAKKLKDLSIKSGIQQNDLIVSGIHLVLAKYCDK
jgi:hypothetical protein